MDNNFGAAERTQDENLFFKFHGTKGDIFRIEVVNSLLSIITLGFYRFWAKTRFRRYVWSHLELGGDRFEYTGRGMELFLGFCVAILALTALGIVNGIASFVLPVDSPFLVLENLIYSLIIWFLVNFAYYRARRYRLTRTNWRGLRFTQTGSAAKFSLKMMVWQFVVGITIFLAYPAYRKSRQRHLINETYFGDEKFVFQSEGKSIVGLWLVSWLLFIPTLGFSYVWYRVREFNNFANRVHLGANRFVGELSSWKAIKIVFVYMLIQGVILGLLGSFLSDLIPGLSAIFSNTNPSQINIDPSEVFVLMVTLFGFMIISSILGSVFFTQPLIKAVSNGLSIHGPLDLGDIHKATDQVPQRGEGFFDALDVGGI